MMMCYHETRKRGGAMMNKMISVSKRLDTVFKVMGILLSIVLVACFVGIAIIAVGLIFKLPPELIFPVPWLGGNSGGRCICAGLQKGAVCCCDAAAFDDAGVLDWQKVRAAHPRHSAADEGRRALSCSGGRAAEKAGTACTGAWRDAELYENAGAGLHRARLSAQSAAAKR